MKKLDSARFHKKTRHISPKLQALITLSQQNVAIKVAAVLSSISFGLILEKQMSYFLISLRKLPEIMFSDKIIKQKLKKKNLWEDVNLLNFKWAFITFI